MGSVSYDFLCDFVEGRGLITGLRIYYATYVNGYCTVLASPKHNLQSTLNGNKNETNNYQILLIVLPYADFLILKVNGFILNFGFILYLLQSGGVNPSQTMVKYL